MTTSWQINDDLMLKLFELADAEALFAAYNANRAHLRRWLSAADVPDSLAATQHYIAACGIRYSGTWKQAVELTAQGVSFRGHVGSGEFDAGIWYRGELAGVVNLNHLNRGEQSGEIGYWLGVRYTGQGLATAAARVVADHGFNTLRLNRMAIRCAAQNLRSRAVAERLGFRLERTVPGGEVVDAVRYDQCIYGMWGYKWRGEPHPLVARRRGMGAG